MSLGDWTQAELTLASWASTALAELQLDVSGTTLTGPIALLTRGSALTAGHMAWTLASKSVLNAQGAPGFAFLLQDLAITNGTFYYLATRNFYNDVILVKQTQSVSFGSGYNFNILAKMGGPSGQAFQADYNMYWIADAARFGGVWMHATVSWTTNSLSFTVIDFTHPLLSSVGQGLAFLEGTGGQPASNYFTNCALYALSYTS